MRAYPKPNNYLYEKGKAIDKYWLECALKFIFGRALSDARG
jgi:hypothetical protein